MINMEHEYTKDEISMILDTFMYVGDIEYEEGESLGQIVSKMPQMSDINGQYKEEYAILKDAVNNPKIAELEIACPAQKMGYNEGTNAVTFVSPDKENVYVVYRGTADGEWPDNGKGLIDERTTQQDEAVRYFDEVVETLGITSAVNLTVTGHSKGGNKAQYVTMDSKYADLIDQCYSIDGQGHSDAAINMWKERYSEEEYAERVAKIYGINGENDFVSVLGNVIIASSNIRYIKTPVPAMDVAGYHDITGMFAGESLDEDGNPMLTYTSLRNDIALNRGKFADGIAKLSKRVMEMPEFIRKCSTATTMQIAEAVGGERTVGINNERLSVLEAGIFAKTGIPVILLSLVGTGEGKQIINSLFNKEDLVKTVGSDVNISLNYLKIEESAQNLQMTCDKINALLSIIETAGLAISLRIDGVAYKKACLQGSIISLKVTEMKFRKLSQIQSKIASLYKKFDCTIPD